MSENVVSLHGAYVPAAPETSKVVIEELERLLEAARSGEIIGLAGSFVHSNKTITYSYAGKVAGFGMIGGIECLKERLAAHRARAGVIMRSVAAPHQRAASCARDHAADPRAPLR